MVNALSHGVPAGNRVRASTLVLVSIQLLGIASATLAAPGDLDFTFGEAGRVFIDLGDQPSYSFRLIQQVDGKLVVASTIYDTTHAQRFLARLETDGTLDGSFGNGGIVISPTLDETTADVIQQADGKLVVAGDAWVQGYNAALWRLDLDGSADATFGTGGKASLDIGGFETASRLLQQEDGKLVIAGTSEISNGDQRLLVARFHPDGSLDATFGSNGSVIVDFTNSWLATTALLRQSDGKLVVAGHQRGEVTVARFTADGVLDESFNGDGTLEIAATAIDSTHNFTSGGSATLADDGRIVVVGEVSHTSCCDDWGDPTIYRDGFIVRLQPNGAIDPTFGVAGIVTAPVTFAAVAAQADGKLTVAFSDSYSMGLQRFTLDGNVDDSFGDGGNAIFELGWPDTPHLYFADAMIRQTDGNFVLVGGYAVAAGPGWNAAIGRFVADDTGPVPPANVSFTSSAAISVREDAGLVTLYVSRSGSSVGEVSVEYATESETAQAGADFLAAHGERLWAAGDSSPNAITVNITNDATEENDETFKVALSNPSAGAILGSNSTVTVTIVDDDPSGGGGGDQRFELLTIAATVSEGGSTALSVARIGPASGAVSVDFATSSGSATAGSDYTSASGTLHWVDGDSADKTITVNSIDDATDEGVETFALTLSNASGAAVGSNSTATVTITDNDPPPPPDVDGGGGGGGGGVLDWLAVLALTCFGVGSRIRERPLIPRCLRISDARAIHIPAHTECTSLAPEAKRRTDRWPPHTPPPTASPAHAPVERRDGFGVPPRSAGSGSQTRQVPRIASSPRRPGARPGIPSTQFPIVRGCTIDAHGWSADGARNPCVFNGLEMVARDGIEPSTRGFRIRTRKDLCVATGFSGHIAAFPAAQAAAARGAAISAPS